MRPTPGQQVGGNRLGVGYLCTLWGRLSLADVAQHMRPILQVDADLVEAAGSDRDTPPGPHRTPPHGRAHLDDVEAHVDDVLGAGAIVSGPGVTLEGVAEVPTVEVVVT